MAQPLGQSLSHARPALWVLAFAALAALVLQTRAVATEHRPPAVETIIDVPPFPAEVARPFSFGFYALVADLTFLQAIQVYGARKPSVSYAAGLHEDKLLDKLLTYSTDLDPKFRGAYRFAGDCLLRHTSDGKAAGVFTARRLMEKAVRERPDEWRHHYMLGFIDLYYLGEAPRAAVELGAAARIAGSPAYLGMLAARLATQAGDLDLAERMALEMSEQTTEESTRAEWQERLISIRMERQLRAIEAALQRYRERVGAPAPSLEALVQAGDLPAIPPEPHGGRYLLGPDGTPVSSAAPRLRVRPRALSGMEPK